ncbi:UNVERIFIED_ORG: hypothetical protein J2X79_000229 [Arthrobacter globiformis]|nr:hypothetical protein [Arthrobacter globiformis]
MSQAQKAGANSQQTAIAGNVTNITNNNFIQQGVSEERAAEIADQRARLAIEEYSKEAQSIAFPRMQELDTRVIRILSDEGKLGALADPAYQIALQKAQVGAASTEREGDYDLLARLLGQRASQDTRFVRASVDRAIQVVDMIDDSALQGLNMLWAIGALTPGGVSLDVGIKQAEELFGTFPHDKLPMGRRWIDHLDILDLVRVVPAGITTLKKFVPFFAERWPGFLSVGMEGEVAAEVKIQCLERGIDALGIVEHELKPGYYRLPYRDAAQVRSIMQARKMADTDIEFVAELARDKGKVDVLDDALVPKLEEAISGSSVLSQLRTWWDQIPDFPQATSAGITVAYANSRRFHDFENVTGLAAYLEQSV